MRLPSGPTKRQRSWLYTSGPGRAGPCASRATHIGSASATTRTSFFIAPFAPFAAFARSESILDTQLELARARAVEAREVVGRVDLVRAGVPLRHRAVVEHVEDVQACFGAMLAAQP